MAKIVSEATDFKVAEVSQIELMDKLGPLGAKGVCDFCMSEPETGYYVAVLDQWLCPKCYNEFIQNNTPDPRDNWFEDVRFAWFKRQFHI